MTTSLKMACASRDVDPLHSFVDELRKKTSSEWAWEHYKETIGALVSITRARNVLEIGGGRWPLLSTSEACDIRYLVNDISESELELAPPYVDKVCFDIAKPLSDNHRPLLGTVNVMFSQMVFEHVTDAMQAYRNIHALLAPGGVCLNFHPVLYAAPFVVNWLLPEKISREVLRLFFPNRRPDEVPKHPAWYDMCVISDSNQRKLASIGFKRVWQVPFWHHDYFKKIPGVYHVDHAVALLAERKEWPKFASYSYTMVSK